MQDQRPTYTFRDVLTNMVHSKQLSAVRALFILARHDLEMKYVYSPLHIEHNGKRYEREDILRLTMYSHEHGVKVLWREESAA